MLGSDFAGQLGFLLPKKMVPVGFIGSEYLKLFSTPISPGATHCGEHFLLLLRLLDFARISYWKIDSHSTAENVPQLNSSELSLKKTS